jgi:hypothetical protein
MNRETRLDASLEQGAKLLPHGNKKGPRFRGPFTGRIGNNLFMLCLPGYILDIAKYRQAKGNNQNIGQHQSSLLMV